MTSRISSWPTATRLSAPEDPISGDPNILGIPMPSAGDLGQFGPNPLTLPLEQLSTEAAVTPTDNVPRDGAYTHADYPRTGGNGELRTTGYNLAIIAADLADVLTDDGKDRLVR